MPRLAEERRKTGIGVEAGPAVVARIPPKIARRKLKPRGSPSLLQPTTI